MVYVYCVFLIARWMWGSGYFSVSSVWYVECQLLAQTSPVFSEFWCSFQAYQKQSTSQAGGLGARLCCWISASQRTKTSFTRRCRSITPQHLWSASAEFWRTVGSTAAAWKPHKSCSPSLCVHQTAFCAVASHSQTYFMSCATWENPTQNMVTEARVINVLKSAAFRVFQILNALKAKILRLWNYFPPVCLDVYKYFHWTYSRCTSKTRIRSSRLFSQSTHNSCPMSGQTLLISTRNSLWRLTCNQKSVQKRYLRDFTNFLIMGGRLSFEFLGNIMWTFDGNDHENIKKRKFLRT